jgi:hypothetical protein
MARDRHRVSAARRPGGSRPASRPPGGRVPNPGPARPGRPLEEFRIVRGCAAVVALALGAYCFMVAATAPPVASPRTDVGQHELVSRQE